MANVIRKATNKFTKGLVMDFSPENTKNEVLTHALNATLLTFNGNELALQNDMGNARVETAYLPEGYIPVGTCEYGGIIYIVSYNPLENKSQIGCFPSPERNISSDELGNLNTKISKDYFQKFENDTATGDLKQTSQYILLKNDNLNPGDKYIVTSNTEVGEELLKDLYIIDDANNEQLVANPVISLSIVSIEDSGKITYLNNDVRKYESVGTHKYKYHIAGQQSVNNFGAETIDIDSYRTILSSGYTVFKSKTSGKLAILAELIMIDSYSVTHSIQASTDIQAPPNQFNILIHTEVSPTVTEDNYDQVPKLKYYYLENSQGYLSTCDDNGVQTEIPMFVDYSENQDFYKTRLSDIYTSTFSNLSVPTEPIEKLGTFSFAKPNTYHARLSETGVPDFIPTKNSCAYEDVTLGTIILPEFVCDNGLDLPFKYQYSITPCMNYGKLNHLTISNTIDFSKLHDFNKSNFTTWKYFIGNDQLKLTFGADVYDTYESNKIDGLVLEFYDLWGFAGSLEIFDKKSYSGIFTKILPLNTKNILSKKKINVNEQYEGFKRNINIVKNGNTYFLKDVEVSKDPNNLYGWGYKSEDSWTSISEEDDDCGTIYSNILYGVKTYLKRTTKVGTEVKTEFIGKDDFFLYTLPIYNDYYTTINNFNTLENPELDLVLSYRLEDSCKIKPFEGLSVDKGYTEQDYNNVSEYLKGIKKDTTSMSVTKFYAYDGTSKLQLEIGLKEEYQDFNISYDPRINQYFSCELFLSGQNENILDIYSSDETINSDIILNYLPEFDQNSLNKINENSTKVQINGSFENYNFIHNKSNKFIPIKYDFVVGYKATINDISKQQVQATTICALCHRNSEGKYNYEDFGIYEQYNQDNIPEYLSDKMFFNGGDSKTSIFGICKQIKTSGSMIEQCQSITSIETETYKSQTPGKLNTGDPLRQLTNYIGKLTFCQPHVHGLSETTGVNINYQEKDTSNPYNIINYGIPAETEKVYGKDGHGKEDTRGIPASNYLYTNPLYNLCFNTKNSILYSSEFISALDSKATHGRVYARNYGASGSGKFFQNIPIKLYTGFTGKEVASFNEKLIKTMQNVYAYNPDYNLLEVNKGNVEIQKYYPIFKSNLLSRNSKLTKNGYDLNLNQFIYIGTIKFADYLKEMYINSEGLRVYSDDSESIPIDVLQLKPGFEYCGTDTNPYLISTLTYNTPAPNEFAQELEFTSDNILIKHHDGEISYLKGNPDKRALYGYNKEFNQMIQLDVSNYTIDPKSGDLTLKNAGTVSDSITIELKNINLQGNTLSNFINFGSDKIQVDLDLKISPYSVSTTFISKELKRGIDIIDKDFYNGIFIGTRYNDQGNFQISPSIKISNQDAQYSYNIELKSITFDYYTQVLNDKVELVLNMGQDNKPLLKDLRYLELNTLVSSEKEIITWDFQDITIPPRPLTPISLDDTGIEANLNKYYQIEWNMINFSINNQNKSQHTASCTVENPSNIDFSYEKPEKYDGEYAIGLIKIIPKSITLDIIQTKALKNNSEAFVAVPRTNKYSTVISTPTEKNDNSEIPSFNVNSYVLDYENSALAGSSITINDLQYEPNEDGHRLFMRNGLFTFDSNLSFKLYYRILDEEEANNTDDWRYGETHYLNNLFFFTGPCFIKDDWNAANN